MHMLPTAQVYDPVHPFGSTHQEIKWKQKRRFGNLRKSIDPYIVSPKKKKKEKPTHPQASWAVGSTENKKKKQRTEEE